MMIDRKGRKLVIYHAGHYGFLSKYLIHKMKKHDKDQVIIFIDCTFASSETKDFLSRWDENNGSGCKVVTYADSIFWKYSAVEEVKNSVIEYFDSLLSSLNLNVEDVDHIYSGYDGLNAFATYLCIKNVRYVLFDILGNTINYSQSESLYDNERVKYSDTAQSYLDLLKEYDVLTARPVCVSSILFTDLHMIASDKNYHNFDYLGSIKTLKKIEKQRLRKIYNLDSTSPREGILVPLRSYASVKYFGVDYDPDIELHQRLLWTYRMIIDCLYTEKDTIILKAHPNYSIPLEVCETVFNSVYVGGHVPFDLLESVGLEFSSILSIGGSSVFFSTVKKTIMFSENLFSAPSEIFAMYSSYVISKIIFDDNFRIEMIDKGDKSRFSPLFVNLSENNVIINERSNIIIVNQKRTAVNKLKNLTESLDEESLIIVQSSDAHTLSYKSFVSYFRITKEKCKEFRHEAMGSISDEFIAILYVNPKYQSVLDNLYHRRTMSRSGLNLIIEPVASWHHDQLRSYDEMFDAVYKCAIAGDSTFMGIVGRAYRDGKGVEKDLSRAAEWMRKAADKNVEWAKNELFDILWQLGTESYKEMINVAVLSADEGDVNAMGRLGRAYRDGKGVEKDLETSAKYLKRVADKHPNWVAEATDLMLITENPDNWSYAFKRCSEVANDSSSRWDGLVKAGVMGRLSHMYRDGKGVEKDLDKAVEWMYKATKQHSKWDKELEEIILKRDGQKETLKQNSVS